MESDKCIGVFDSGVGGTTVLKEIIKVLPNENIIYYGDSGNAPYGDRTVSDIRRLSMKIMEFLMEKKCKAIVIACNTITAAALNLITVKYDIPVIGVISPGVKAAIKVAKNRIIGIVATDFTVSSNAYANEIKKQARDFAVFQEGCPEYCPMIEQGWETYSPEERSRVLTKHLSVFPKEVETVILGCTHYPIAYNDFAKIFKGNIVDPARETAVELKRVLSEKEILNEGKSMGIIDFYISGDQEKFRMVAEKFLGSKIERINIVPR